MKYIMRIMAIVAVIAVLCTVLVGCDKTDVKVEAAKAGLYAILNEVNGEGATEMLLETDTIDISSIEYITFTVEADASSPERTSYLFDVVATTIRNGKGSYDKHYYVNVLVDGQSYTAKMTNEDVMEKYKKIYKTKDGKLKAKQIEQALPPAVEKLIATVKANDKAAKREAILSDEKNSLDTTANGVAERIAAAYENGSITADTTREQFAAILQAINADYVMDLVDPEPEPEPQEEPETPAEPQEPATPAEPEPQQPAEEPQEEPDPQPEPIVYTIFVPASPEGGYTAGSFLVTVSSNHYVVALQVNPNGETIVTRAYSGNR